MFITYVAKLQRLRQPSFPQRQGPASCGRIASGLAFLMMISGRPSAIRALPMGVIARSNTRTTYADRAWRASSARSECRRQWSSITHFIRHI